MAIGTPAYLNRGNVSVAVVVSAVCLGGAFTGLLVAYGGPIVGILLAAAIIGATAFLIPPPLVFGLMICMTFVVVGPIQYFGQVGKIFWLPYLIGLFLLLKASTTHMFERSTQSRTRLDKSEIFPLQLLSVVYVLALVASTAFNQAPVLQILLSLKEYFFLLGAALAIIWGLVRPEMVDRIFKFSHWWLLIQLPVIVYQHFFIAAKRVGSSPWDAVVGLMSGHQEGGGASAAMALCVIVVMTYHLASFRVGLCPWPKLLVVFLAGMASIMLAEVKLAVLMLPFAFAMVYIKEIVHRPLFGFSFLSAALALGIVVVVSYQLQFSSTRNVSGASVQGYVEQVLERNTEIDHINLSTGEMGRVSALKFWASNHGLSDPLHLLLGHGVGASRIGLVTGEVAKRYRFELGRSSLAVLLWEGGLIAAATLTAILLLTAALGFRKSASVSSKTEGVILQTAAVGLVLTILMMPYGPDLIFVSQAQLLAVVLFARVVASPTGIAKRNI